MVVAKGTTGTFTITASAPGFVDGAQYTLNLITAKGIH